MTVGSCKKEVT